MHSTQRQRAQSSSAGTIERRASTPFSEPCSTCLRILVGPAHFGGRTHQLQLHAVSLALAERGHAVTYATAQETEQQLAPLLGRVRIVGAAEECWPLRLDLELALRAARGEPEAQVRADLLDAACDAAEIFFCDERIRSLADEHFDVAVVDVGALSGHLLADALHPSPQVHYMCYPPAAGQGQGRTILAAAAAARRAGPRLQALRASVGAPPKQECSKCHVLTVVGHSAAFVPPDARASLPLGAESCCGSVLASQPAEPLPPPLAEWADAAGSGGFVVVSLGSWADGACTALGKDGAVRDALASLGLPAIWKTTFSSSSGAPNVRTAPWLPQRALLAHRCCRLLVCHGGANSISEACGSGVPVVALHVAWDQPQNAARVAALRLGAALPLSECTAASLLAAMRGVLDDPETPRRAAEMADAMARRDSGAQGAARLVERAVRMAESR